MATSQNDGGAALPTCQCCCCRHGHRDSSPSTEAGVHNLDDRETWKTVQGFYNKGLVGLVIEGRRSCLGELAALLGRGRKQPERNPEDQAFGYRISFADMQRMHLRTVQAKLINMAMAVQFDDDKGEKRGVVETLGPTLRDYVQAIQDHEYMAKFSGQSKDPFVASSERSQDNNLLQRAAIYPGKPARSWGDPSHPDNLVHLRDSAVVTGPWEDSYQNGTADAVASTRAEAIRRALWSRIGGACVGGAFLIAPMWLLVLKQELYIQLGVTTGCVSAFGLLMAWYLPTLEAVFASTLAYSAVLMVFVGVMMGNLSSS